ncbi:MAG: response regulator transcription factor [Phycisphaerae bacterium]|jgi:two-component system response regulator NreC|nr:response regulator transcription factor [Phycisphaerae bacterium]MCZ2400211.1 response regulator transcription factor [Phycisphaerae bacterium]NUQ48432.1 response regulator transcription factor [Phycisphaerae bacterium]
MTRTTIVIVDDHAMVRKGLRMALESHPDLAVVGEAGNVRDAIDLAARLQPQVITLDLTMPGPTGMASVKRLRAAAPAARIIVVTMHDDPAYVRAAIALGASGYVNKSAADTELVAAIRAVVRGRVFIDAGDATLQTILALGAAPQAKAPVDQLSEREREVLAAVARGYTNQQTADELGLSIKTVESYRARLMRKLGLKERSDVVRLAIELGLLSPPRDA